MNHLERFNYAEPLAHRLWMVAMLIALGIFTAGFAPAIIPILGLAYNQRKRLSEEIKNYLNEPRWPITAVLIVIIPLIALSHGGNPPHDDLLRHVASWRHGYNYNELYVGFDPRFPVASMWIGFEWVAGLFDYFIGYWPTVYLIQFLAYSLSVWLSFAIAQRFIPDNAPSRHYWVLAVVTMLLCAGLVQRASLARPEAFLALWALSAMVMPAGRWFLIGLFLMPSYWLAGIYLPAALLLRTRFATQFYIGLALGIYFLGFWWLYSGSGWLDFFRLIHDWTSTRLINPGESNPIQAAIFNPLFILAVALFLFRSTKPSLSQTWPFLVVAAWFLLPAQVRYLGAVGPLLLVILISGYKYHALNTASKALGLLVMAMLLIDAAPPSDKAQGTLPDITLPDNSRLLTEFDVPVYYLPTVHKGLRVAPAMDVGAVKRPIQEGTLALSGKGELNCKMLRDEGFTHVLERHLLKAPECISYAQATNGWRLWNVNP